MPKATDISAEASETPAPAPNIVPAADTAPTGMTLGAPAETTAPASALVGREVTLAVEFPPVAPPAAQAETPLQSSVPTPPCPVIPVRVANALSVQTPDGVDHPAGSVIDGAVFEDTLLAHYLKQEYLAPHVETDEE